VLVESEKFDVIVVGAGVAGSATVIRLMQLDPSLNVALVDRGTPVGSKNVSCGVFWGNSLGEIIPEWWEKAPIERVVTRKRTGFLTSNDALVIDLSFPEWVGPPPNAVTILLSRFAYWLAKEAERLGANLYEGINVDDLARGRDGKINGILQAGDMFKADVVVLADGANSRLTLSSGLRSEMKRENYGLGVKEVLKLPADVIEQRFNLEPTTGSVGEYVMGGLPSGIRSGGFLYTNKDTLSLGCVIQVNTMNDPDIPPVDILESFKEHPSIRNLIEDSVLTEYSAHLVPETGINMVPQLFDNGVLVVGDAAGFVISNGMVIQGLNYAVKSGILAADTIRESMQVNDFSRKSLRKYEEKLERSYVLKDLRTFKNTHKIISNPRVYDQYPELLVGTFRDMLTEDLDKPKAHVQKLMRQRRKQHRVGWFSLLRDLFSFRHL
jgi:electron transfer flavoprotein-quinone oxidoreductase